MERESSELQPKEERLPILVERHEVFSGPLPHPDLLQKYEQVVPGAAKEIIEMAHHQAKFREELEQTLISSDIASAKLGLWFGFMIGIFGIATGAFLIYNGHEYTGAFITGGTIVSLVGVFVYGSQQKQMQQSEKERE